jgi:hypothetical protein
MIRSALAFLLCGVALLVVLRAGVRRGVMAASVRMFERALANRTIRIAMLLAWWWLGWHFLVGRTVDPGGVGL